MWAVAIDRDSVSVPRGRHAPPLEVRLEVQRTRLFEAAAAVFARVGYAEASAESISREAGMSKATFYEHFANKEECLLALFDEASRQVIAEMAEASAQGDFATYEERVRAGVGAFLGTLAANPDSAYTLIVSILGAGPRAAARRDAILATFADTIYRDNARFAPAYRRADVRRPRRRLRDRRRGGRARGPPPARRARARRPRARAGHLAADPRRAGPRRDRVRAAEELARLEDARHRLPALPAAGRLARAGGARAPRLVRGRDLLGPAGARLRRPAGARRHPRPGPGRPRRQPHGARLHRRPVGRLPLRRPAPRGLRQQPGLARHGRRPRPARPVDHRGRALRATAEPPDAGRARHLPALDRGRAARCWGTGSAW